MLDSIIYKLFKIPKIARFNQQPVRNPLSFLLKTHIYFNNYNYKKIIYCVRDGRDVMLSYYFYQKEFVRKHFRIKSSYNFDDTLEDRYQFEEYLKYRFLTKDFPYLNWADHVERAIKEDNIVFIKYEDLKSDTYCSYYKLLKKLGIKIDEKRLRDVCEEQSFSNEKMRLKMIDNSLSLHLRKGVIGGWEEIFTDVSLKYFNEKAGRIMKLLGYY